MIAICNYVFLNFLNLTVTVSEFGAKMVRTFSVILQGRVGGGGGVPGTNLSIVNILSFGLVLRQYSRSQVPV